MLMLSSGSGCSPMTSSPLISPHLWESRLTQLRYGGLQGLLAGVPVQDICDAGGWSTPLTFQVLRPGSASHPWLVFSLALAVHSTHYAGICKYGGVDISFPIASRRSSMFPEGSVPGYVCNPGSPRERDAASQGHTSGIPTRAMLHSCKLAPAAHHVLLSILVMTSPHLTSGRQF